MDGEIGVPLAHRMLDFLDEHSLTTDRVQRHFVPLVTEGFDEDEFVVAP